MVWRWCNSPPTWTSGSSSPCNHNMRRTRLFRTCIVPSRSVWNPPPTTGPADWSFCLGTGMLTHLFIKLNSWLFGELYISGLFPLFSLRNEEESARLFSWQFMQIWATVALNCFTLNRLAGTCWVCDCFTSWRWSKEWSWSANLSPCFTSRKSRMKSRWPDEEHKRRMNETAV